MRTDGEVLTFPLHIVGVHILYVRSFLLLRCSRRGYRRTEKRCTKRVHIICFSIPSVNLKIKTSSVYTLQGTLLHFLLVMLVRGFLQKLDKQQSFTLFLNLYRGKNENQMFAKARLYLCVQSFKKLCEKNL